MSAQKGRLSKSTTDADTVAAAISRTSRRNGYSGAMSRMTPTRTAHPRERSTMMGGSSRDPRIRQPPCCPRANIALPPDDPQSGQSGPPDAQALAQPDRGPTRPRAPIEFAAEARRTRRDRALVRVAFGSGRVARGAAINPRLCGHNIRPPEHRSAAGEVHRLAVDRRAYGRFPSPAIAARRDGRTRPTARGKDDRRCMIC